MHHTFILKITFLYQYYSIFHTNTIIAIHVIAAFFLLFLLFTLFIKYLTIFTAFFNFY